MGRLRKDCVQKLSNSEIVNEESGKSKCCDFSHAINCQNAVCINRTDVNQTCHMIE